MSTFLKETVKNAAAKPDWFGFRTLSLAIGAAQVLLDRDKEPVLRVAGPATSLPSRSDELPDRHRRLLTWC
jgi:hypothetical protein